MGFRFCYRLEKPWCFPLLPLGRGTDRAASFIALYVLQCHHQNWCLTRCRVFTKVKCPTTLQSWLFYRTINHWRCKAYSLALPQAMPSCIIHSTLCIWNHLSSSTACTLYLGPFGGYFWTILLHVCPNMRQEERQLLRVSTELYTQDLCLSAALALPLQLGCRARARGSCHCCGPYLFCHCGNRGDCSIACYGWSRLVSGVCLLGQGFSCFEVVKSPPQEL